MSRGKNHTVRQGESAESIAYEAGHLWQTVWEHAANAPLRKRRKSPHVLFPSDVIFVPEIEIKTVACQTNARHVFRRKGVPSRLRIRFLASDQPRANAAYVLIIDQKSKKNATTDGDGWLDEPISPAAQTAEVRFPFSAADPPLPGESAAEKRPDEVYVFALRTLDPISEISGVQGRLRNLGYDIGPINGKLTSRTRTALRSFQKKHGLPTTGRIDAATEAKLAQFGPG